MEILIVNDGSRDKTLDLVKEYSKKYNETADPKCLIRGLNLVQNQGKGAAVKLGALFSLGNVILFSDADGATDIRDTLKCLKLKEQVKAGAKTEVSAIVIGNRNAGQPEVQRNFIRKFVSTVYSLIVRAIIGFRLEDTQCGFKMFDRAAAKLIFPT